MEGHIPTTQPIPKEAVTGLSRDAAPTPYVGKPGDVNGRTTTPQVEGGVNGGGGNSSLPSQSQVPV
jgi:hypothetical protein